MMKRILALLALFAVLVPIGARAETTTYAAPYVMAHANGGDSSNYFVVDPATGSMTVLRAAAGAVQGLGCGGSGGFANFAVAHNATTPVSTVSVAYTDTLIDPYSWINIGVRQDGHFLGSRVERGLLAGSGSVTLNLEAPATGPLAVWFGIQVSSACPNVDGGTAKFTSVTLS